MRVGRRFFGVHVGLAEKIFQHYRPSALNVVQADPYRLVWEVAGIGFKTADRAARGLGWPLTMPSRLDAGIVYTLRQTVKDGHVYVPLPYLVGRAVPLLNVGEHLLAPTLDRLKDKGHIQQETLPGQTNAAIYLASLYRAEIGVAVTLCRMLCSVESRLADCYGIEPEDECDLSPEQH